MAVALGAVAGALVGLLSAPSHRAVATLSVSKGSSLLAATTVAAFARSKVVADNVGVHGGLHARAIPETALVELSYPASSPVRALQVVQQAAVALGALAPARFPGVQVQVVDPPHTVRGERPVWRDLLVGALLGLLVGGLTLVRLPQREAQVPGTAAAVPGTDLAPPPPPEPEPEPEPEPQPAPDPLAGYRTLLAEHGHEFSADQVAEWQAYLDAFAAQTVDGELPPGLAGMLSDVFEPLLARTR